MSDRNGQDLLHLLVAGCSVGASWKRCLYFTLNAILNAVCLFLDRSYQLSDVKTGRLISTEVFWTLSPYRSLVSETNKKRSILISWPGSSEEEEVENMDHCLPPWSSVVM